MNPPLPPPPLLSAAIIASASSGPQSSGVIQRPASGSTDQMAHLRPQTRPSV